MPVSCTPSQGTAPRGGDCDDGNNQLYPGQTELCDTLDNDCDGKVDEGLLTVLDTRVWTQPTPDEPASTHLALAPRREGGAWLLHGYTPSAPTFSPTPLGVWQLAQEGTLVGEASEPASTLDKLVGDFVADGDGTYVAVARVRIVEDWGGIELYLLNAETLSYVAGATVLTVNAALAIPSLHDISVMQDSSGQVRVGLAYTNRYGGDNEAVFVVYELAQHQLMSSGITKALATGDTLNRYLDATIERIPCRDEWLFAARLSKGGGKRGRLDADGKEIDVDQEALGLPSMLRARPTRCGKEDPELLALTNDQVWRLRVSRSSASLSRVGVALSLSTGAGFGSSASAVYKGGLWYVTTKDLDQGGKATLWEVDLNASLDSPARRIELFTAPSDPNPGSGFASSTSVATDSTLVVGFPNGFGAGGGGNQVSNLNSLRSNGVTDPAVGVTYRLGCPAN